MRIRVTFVLVLWFLVRITECGRESSSASGQSSYRIPQSKTSTVDAEDMVGRRQQSGTAGPANGTETNTDMGINIEEDRRWELNAEKESWGMDIAHYTVDTALASALKQANSSLVQLNKLFTPPADFAKYMESLHANASATLKASIDATARHGTITPSVLKICEAELSARLYGRMTPIFKRQVALLKQEVTTAFNKRVLEDTPLSVYILEDLNEAMHDTLRNFTTLVRAITPPGAPRSQWNADFEAYELAQVMQEYIEGREYLYRAMGVLPRYGGSSGASPNALRLGSLVLDPPPTEVSVHVLVNHPLGRDYRQDPLSVRESDQLAYVAGKTSPPPAPAADLRAALKRRVGILQSQQRTHPVTSRITAALGKLGIHLPSQLRRESVKSEFAREMMMLPLSLKNPDLSAASGGGISQQTLRRRRGRGAAAEGDAEKEADEMDAIKAEGPERFVRWDLPPLGEAKHSLDMLSSSAVSASAAARRPLSERLLDQVLGKVPPLKRSFYPQPAVDYGPAYAPSAGPADS